MLNMNKILLERDLTADIFKDIDPNSLAQFYKVMHDFFTGHSAFDDNNGQLLTFLKSDTGKQILDIIKQNTHEQWHSWDKKLYRGLKFWTHSLKYDRSKFSPTKLKSSLDKESYKILNKKKYEKFKISAGTQYPLQHWTVSYGKALEFIKPRSLPNEDYVIVSVDMPVDMVIMDTTIMDYGLMAHDISMAFVKTQEEEVAVWHHRPLVCTVEYNSYNNTWS